MGRNGLQAVADVALAYRAFDIGQLRRGVVEQYLLLCRAGIIRRSMMPV
jgi:hypothetical protein